jgi:hypothetical protein
MRAAHIALACLLLGGSAAAQQAPVTAARVAGVVVDAQTGVALRRARIAPTAPTSRLAPVFTDELGHFSLDVPGDVTLTISKAGYAREIVKVASLREAPSELRVVMKRGAAITGRGLTASACRHSRRQWSCARCPRQWMQTRRRASSPL